MKKLLLISMPDAPINAPPSGIAVLQTFLKQSGIKAETLSLYVLFADRLGYSKYYHLSQRHVFAEALFANLIYPEMRTKTLEAIKRDIATIYKIYGIQFDHDNLLLQAHLFIEEALGKISFDDYEYVGFSVVYHQLFSSLALAKRIKEIAPKVKIVFGGNLCSGEKGVSLMEVYPQIDYCISYEGEYPLLCLMRGKFLKDIPALTFRKGNKIIINPPGEKIVSLDKLGIPDFTEYFQRIEEARHLKKIKNFTEYLRIPVETARGCWWNKCTFCSLNFQCLKYREKSTKKIVSEIKHQVRKYDTASIMFVNNNIKLKGTRELFRILKPLHLNIFAEYSAHLRDFSLLQELKESGVHHIQFGLESLSKTLLEKKIKKGVRLIDNVQMLKWLKELNICSGANIMWAYPNETRREFDEAISNFKYLYHLELPHLVKFNLVQGSPISNNPKLFNIKSMFPAKLYKAFIPPQILKRFVLDHFDFNQKVGMKHPYHIFNRELDRWKNKFVNNSTYPLLYYVVKDGMAIIVDSRYGKIFKYFLNKDKTELYLFCHSVRSLDDICRHFKLMSKNEVLRILSRFHRYRLMFKDGDNYVGLAINWQRHREYLLKDGVKNDRFSMGRMVRICK